MKRAQQGFNAPTIVDFLHTVSSSLEAGTLASDSGRALIPAPEPSLQRTLACGLGAAAALGLRRRR